MQKLLNGQWPLVVFVIMFLILPFSTLDGMFEPVFVMLGALTVLLAVLLIASLVTSITNRKGEN
jgi:hypothetical protein